MLAHPELVIAELVGQDRLGGVLGEGVGQRAAGRMHRHHENPKTHGIPFLGVPFLPRTF
jgi:hypothetical protein